MEAVERENSAPPEADDYAGRVKLTAYMAEKRLTVRGIAETLKGSGWPRCSGAAVSMAARPNETGVQLVAGAYRALYDAHGVPSDRLRRRRRDARTLPCRITVRLSKAELEALNTARGCITVQDYVRELIFNAVFGKGGARDVRL